MGTLEAECKVEKTGNDSYIGDTYSAPCGWATYNKLDVSHYKWHQIMQQKGEMGNEPI